MLEISTIKQSYELQLDEAQNEIDGLMIEITSYKSELIEVRSQAVICIPIKTD